MKNSLVNKGLIVTIIFLFIGLIVIPSINGYRLKINGLDDKKSESNCRYFNSYNTPDNTSSLFGIEDNLYVITNKFGLHEYTYSNSRINFDQCDSYQSLKYIQIKRFYGIGTTEKINKNFDMVLSGNIFYVGGSGSDNYTSIQDAINDASKGDTVFVYDDSSPYYENIVIDKSIQLIGENKDSTIINGFKLDSFLNTINITANNVNVYGFSINDNQGYYYQASIMITGEHVTISNCKIYNNRWIGISIIDSSYSQIIDCELFNNLIAVYLVDSSENEIKNCFCHENSDDILLFQNSHNNIIVNCTCIGNGFSGIHVQQSSGNEIINCTIRDGYEGIGLSYAPNTLMQGNVLNNNYENFGIGSSYLSDFYCDIDTSNTINDKPIYYWNNYHNEQIPSDAGFIGLISCTNISIKNLEMANNFQGIVCAGTSDSTIENCTFNNNGGHGVFFISSAGNIIKNCLCKDSFFSGIYLNSQSNNNNIYNNTFSNIQVCGLWVEDSTSNNFSKHIIKNCGKGISLDNSGNSVLRNNSMVNCGLAVDGNGLSDYINDVDTSNKINGKILYYYVEKDGLKIPSDAGEVVLVNCSYCNVSNLELSNATIGVILAFSSHNFILGNTLNGNSLVAIDLDCSSNNYNTINANIIQENNYGIDVDLSHYNTVQDNIIYNNSVALSLDSSHSNLIVGNDIKNSWNGIYLSNSNNNNVNSNSIQNSGFNGIYLLYSKDNIIKANEMVNCGLLVYGNSLSEFIHDVDTSNKVNGKMLYYYINENGITVPNDAGEVILVNCEYCNITDLDLSDGTIGVELAYSNFNTISKNTLNDNNYAGIYLESSNDNIVKTNTIEDNNYGINLQLAYNNNIKNNNIRRSYYGFFIYLSDNNTFEGNDILYNSYGIRFDLPSNSNSIYHNNLISNGYNAWDENGNTNKWDDGKKGNYWGDYKVRYPDAKMKPFKGIWDIPYEVPDGNNKDVFPLLKKWSKSLSIYISKSNSPYFNFNLFRWLFEQFPNTFLILQLLQQRLELQ